VKGPAKLLLGIVTSIAGFVEVGSISTSIQAGASFRYSLAWAVVLATACLATLIEMSGRLAAVSKHSLADAVRERFGIRFQVFPLAGEILLDLLVLTAEIGGVTVALQLATGIPAQWFALPVGIAVWVLLWKGTFGLIENGVSMLGLVTLCFVVAAFVLKPPAADVLRGLVPSLPGGDRAAYGFLAVSILGATVSPYLLNFYASGAIEDEWKEKDVGMGRLMAAIGIGFGGAVSLAILVVAGATLHPAGIRADDFHQAALSLVPAFGGWGLPLFCASLAVGCFGAALEVPLNLSYAFAQALGWTWGENLKPKDDARFCLVYTFAVAVAVVPILLGAPPLKVTMISMALTVVLMPLVVLPFLVVMNDSRYVGTHHNGPVGNAAVVLIVVAGFVLALVAIPLEVLGG
jgi:Mn2+/Fe2+ NRAMP family transporter